MINSKLSRLFFIVLVALAGGAACSKSKAAAKACSDANMGTMAGLQTCYDGCTQFFDTSDGIDMCSTFDTSLTAACASPSSKDQCDKFCPLRIVNPGSKLGSMAMSTCVMKGYGTLDGKVATKKPDLVTEDSPEVIEPCIGECGGRSGADPSSDKYQSCFRGCKIKKAAELNKK